MHFVQKINFEFGIKREGSHSVSDGADVVNISVGSGVYFVQIVLGHSESVGKDAGYRRLACAFGAGKDVRVSSFPALEGAFKRGYDALLPDDFIKLFRPVF